MMGLTFSDAIVQNLARAAEDVVNYYLDHMPPEDKALLGPTLAARKARLILGICTDPPEIICYVQPTHPALGQFQCPLFKIVAPTEGANDKGI